MPNLKYLQDLWNDDSAQQSGDALDLLRYRSNLLGADLRITNFGGGNTSSKLQMPDPLTGQPTTVLAVKGSGGDLGSIARSGFALLYQDKVEQLKSRYRGEVHEDEMVGLYPLCAFGENRVAASIDTPLHAFLPFPHVDHLHPDWAIALAASANGRQKMEEFNTRFGHRIAWLPWQRPGFELGLMLARAIEANPDCDGIILGSHGLFTWGSTQRECYLNSVVMIDQMGEFVNEHQARIRGFGGVQIAAHEDRRKIAAAILPRMRGLFGQSQRSLAHYNDSDEVLAFAGSTQGQELAAMGTSCPDHFLRTRICPLFVDWNAHTEDLDALRTKIHQATLEYRRNYLEYYQRFATPASPPLRDTNPTVVLIPGIGLFSFGKNKKEARITGEFFVNAIHVMSGATALEDAETPPTLQSDDFRSLHNYVALPQSEAFRIEYWELEEAKLRRMPAEALFSRKIILVVGGGSGIGRAVALQLASRGAHVMVADRDTAGAAETASLATAACSCSIDLCSRASISAAIEETVLAFGGLDGVVNTAAIFPVAASGKLDEKAWALTLDINVTGNFVLAEEAHRVVKEQGLSAGFVFTSSANAVVAKHGSEAYDVSKSAVNQLIRELSIGLAPLVRVNGIAPATVVAGSSMFPRDRVAASLAKYAIPFDESDSTEELRGKLAGFYAQRTVTKLPILPEDCANAICWLLSPQSAKTTGHIIPVDGGLPEAFLR